MHPLRSSFSRFLREKTDGWTLVNPTQDWRSNTARLVAFEKSGSSDRSVDEESIRTFKFTISCYI